MDKVTDKKPILYSSLDFEQSFLLYALLYEAGRISIEIYKDNNFLSSKEITEEKLLFLINKNILKINKEDCEKVKSKISSVLENNGFIDLLSFYTSQLSSLDFNIGRNDKNIIEKDDLYTTLKSDINECFSNYDNEEIMLFFIKICSYDTLSYLYDDGFVKKLNENHVKKLYEATEILLEKYTPSQTKGIINVNYKSIIKRKNIKNTTHRINAFIKNIREYDGEMKNYERYKKIKICTVSKLFCLIVLKNNTDYFTRNIFEYWNEKRNAVNNST
jgi:hypothetical protein